MIYTYKCSKCKAIKDISVPIAKRNDKQVCDCGGKMKRQFSVPDIHIPMNMRAGYE